HNPCKQPRHLEQASFGTARDVEYFVADARFDAQNICASYIADVNEVHSLFTVPINDRPSPSFQTFHPANEHFRISAVNVHARTIGIEVSKGDIVEPIGFVECAQEAFSEGFRRTIKS